MKHLILFEKYNFIKEGKLDNFIFSINIKDATKEDIDKLYKMANSYFYDFEKYDSYDEFYNNIFNIEPKRWAIIFNMYPKVLLMDDSTSRWTQADIIKNVIKAAVSFVSTPNWGEGYSHMDNIITLDEFFNVGFKNVEEYINMKQNMKKYNI